MPVPKKRHSQSRSDRHHSAWRLEPTQTAQCPHCGAATLPHRVCTECGTYKGIPVLKPREAKAGKKGQ